MNRKLEGEKDQAEEPQKVTKMSPGLAWEPGVVTKFAKTLLAALEKYTNFEEAQIFKYLGVPSTERSNFEKNYPLYRQSESCYIINQFIEKHCKVEHISYFGEDHETPALMKELRVSRDKWVQCFVRAHILLTYKKVKMVLYISFRYDSAYLELVMAKKHEKYGKIFLEELRRFMKEESYLKGEKLKYLVKGRIGFLDYTDYTWKNIILQGDTRELIDTHLIYPLQHPKELIENGLPWKRGILLEGNPGTGKTLLGKVLCSKLKCTLIWATAKAVYSAETVKILFDAAKDLAPTLVFLEDIDLWGGERESRGSFPEVLGELLTQLDGIEENSGIFVIATTNKPHLLDKALSERPSRFDIHINFEMPNLETRKKLLELFSVKMPLGFHDFTWLATQTKDNFTPAYLKELMFQACLYWLVSGKGDTITLEHAKKALNVLKKRFSKKGGLMVQ